jgi:hypothetical protein
MLIGLGGIARGVLDSASLLWRGLASASLWEGLGNGFQRTATRVMAPVHAVGDSVRALGCAIREKIRGLSVALLGNRVGRSGRNTAKLARRRRSPVKKHAARRYPTLTCPRGAAAARVAAARRGARLAPWRTVRSRRSTWLRAQHLRASSLFGRVLIGGLYSVILWMCAQTMTPACAFALAFAAAHFLARLMPGVHGSQCRFMTAGSVGLMTSLTWGPRAAMLCACLVFFLPYGWLWFPVAAEVHAVRNPARSSSTQGNFTPLSLCVQTLEAHHILEGRLRLCDVTEAPRRVCFNGVARFPGEVAALALVCDPVTVYRRVRTNGDGACALHAAFGLPPSL